jgi:hypothetical protein
MTFFKGHPALNAQCRPTGAVPGSAVMRVRGKCLFVHATGVFLPFRQKAQFLRVGSAADRRAVVQTTACLRCQGGAGCEATLIKANPGGTEQVAEEQVVAAERIIMSWLHEAIRWLCASRCSA